MSTLQPLKYGKVIGRALAIVADGPDEDEHPIAGGYPDAVPVTGSVTFTPRVNPYVLVAGATPAPATVFPLSITAVIDGAGYLTHNGKRGVFLLVPSVETNPSAWTYRVHYDIAYEGKAIPVPDFDINIVEYLPGPGAPSNPDPGSTAVDLTTVTPVFPSPGNPVIVGPQGEGLQIDGKVATYAALPATPAEGDGAQYVVAADGLLYVYRTGTGWMADGQGVVIRGPQGPAGADGATADEMLTAEYFEGDLNAAPLGWVTFNETLSTNDPAIGNGALLTVGNGTDAKQQIVYATDSGRLATRLWFDDVVQWRPWFVTYPGHEAWADITGKPATFPPDAHAHAIADTTGLQAALDGKVATSDPRLTDQRAPTAAGQVYDVEYVHTVGPRATGAGNGAPMGVKLRRAVRFTEVTYRGATADASGNLVVELRKNGVAVSGTSKTIAAADQTAGGANATNTGTWDFAAGDVLLPWITGVGATPGSGLIADIKGVTL